MDFAVMADPGLRSYLYSQAERSMQELLSKGVISPGIVFHLPPNTTLSDPLPYWLAAKPSEYFNWQGHLVVCFTVMNIQMLEYAEASSACIAVSPSPHPLCTS